MRALLATSSLQAILGAPHDGDGDLGRGDRADGKADRRVDARKRIIRQALRLEPFDAAGVRLLRAQRADVKAVARERMPSAGTVNPSSDFAPKRFLSASSKAVKRNTPFAPAPVTATRISELRFETNTPTSA